VITHRPHLARRTGRIVTLERGSIVHIATPDDARVDSATMKAAV
jgi:ABC-type transport system involved in cytochrome bd biosynthesis fused ATPase/permease subunit